MERWVFSVRLLIYLFSVYYHSFTLLIDVPFHNGTFTFNNDSFLPHLFSNKFHYDTGNSYLRFFYILESQALATTILPYLVHIPLTCQDDHPLILSTDNDMEQVNDQACSSITVEENIFKNLKTSLDIAGYQYLQYLFIQNGSCQQFSEVKIQDLPALLAIVLEKDAFVNTPVLVLKSNSLISDNQSIFHYYLL